MSLKQFNNSVRRIMNNSNINRLEGLFMHLQWQFRKAFNRFPYEQKLSASRIIARHKRCGVSALINSHGLYDYHNMNLLKQLLQNDDIFFDIGANIGSYSLIASEQSNATIFSFEPHPSTFSMLKENIELNHRDNVRLMNMALGAMDREILLTDEEGSATNHIESVRTEKTVSVKCRRADSFCKENRVVPTIVKIDVEGFEHDVLAGFGDQLKSVAVFFVEINGLSDTRGKGDSFIRKLLRKNGFKGPYYFHFNAKEFSNVKNGEDAIFISKSFFSRIPFKISG